MSAKSRKPQPMISSDLTSEQLLKEIDALRKINTQLASLHRGVREQSLGKVLDRVLEGINAILGEGASSSVSLYEKELGKFYSYQSAGPLKDYLRAVPPRLTGPSTSRHVLETGQPLYLDDVRDPPPGRPTIRHESIEQGVRSFAALPLKWQEQIVGMLYVNVQRPFLFSDEVKRILELFASQAAVAIENARIYEQITKDITALQEINEAVVSKGLDEVLQLIVVKAVEVMPGEYSALWLKESDTGDLVLRAVNGPAVETAQEVGRLKDGVASIDMQVAQTGEPRICENTAQETGFYRIYETAQSSVTVPLRYQGRVIGTLDVESSQLNAFTIHHSQLLESFADQAAMAIQNARFYQQERQRAEALKLLQEISGKISSTLNLDEILSLIVEGAMKLTATSSGVVHLLDVASLSIVRSIEYPKGFGHPTPRLSAEKSIARSILDTGRLIAVPDIAKEERVSPVLLQKDIKSLISLPLKLGGRITGLLYLNATQPHQFSEEEQSWLRTLADQAAIAIEKARLIEQLKEEKQTLKAELEAQAQLAALGTATAALRHRINNTLSLISPGILRLRKRVDLSDQDIAETLDIMERNVRYVSDIMRQLKEPLEEAEQTSARINSLLQEVVRKEKERDPAFQNVVVSFDLDQTIPLIEVGAGQISEVFRNLVNNATRAMQPSGGIMTITSRLVESWIEIRIADTGPGIPQSILDRIFVKPVPPKDFGAGAGLGLWLSRLILQRHGGTIQVEKTGPAGTVILVSLLVSAVSSPETANG